MNNSYYVRWMKGVETIAERSYESLEDAKRSARVNLPIWNLREGAKAVVVSDEQGTMLFSLH